METSDGYFDVFSTGSSGSKAFREGRVVFYYLEPIMTPNNSNIYTRLKFLFTDYFESVDLWREVLAPETVTEGHE